MGFRFKQPLVGEKHCVTTLITAAEETIGTYMYAWTIKLLSSRERNTLIAWTTSLFNKGCSMFDNLHMISFQDKKPAVTASNPAIKSVSKTAAVKAKKKVLF